MLKADDQIKITKFIASDFEHYFRLVQNEEVMTYVTGRSISRKEAQKHFNEILKLNQIHPKLGFYKIRSNTIVFLGLAKLKVTSKDDFNVEMGYMVMPEYWNRGVGSKVVEMMIKIVKNEKQISRITAIIDPKNIPSRKILINNKFVTEKFCDIDGWPSEILILNLR